jgi:hypothetical protein
MGRKRRGIDRCACGLGFGRAYSGAIKLTHKGDQDMTTKVTKAGKALWLKLLPSFGRMFDNSESKTVRDLYADGERLCSLICRAAATHHRYQEMACNEPDAPSDAAIEARIRQLVDALPRYRNQPIVPVFSGDPRGATVKLRMPDGRSDDWGGEGICV